METNKIKEIEFIILFDCEERALKLPNSHWLDSEVNKLESVYIKVNENTLFYPFADELQKKTICNKKDLDSLLQLLTVEEEDLKKFRLYLKKTRKWGLKPLFMNGVNSICFTYQFKIFNDKLFLMLFNTGGSRSIESIYIHGIWEIEM